MKSLIVLSTVLLMASSCAAGAADRARGKNLPPEVSHKTGRLRCPLAATGPELRWSEDARASELRRIAVQALLRDTIEREKGEFARPSRWCVFTRVPRWIVPEGVRALAYPAREEDVKPVPGCRTLEVNSMGADWARCSFDGKTVDAISMMARWWREPTEKDAPGDVELYPYGVFTDPHTGQVRIIRYELEL